MNLTDRGSRFQHYTDLLNLWEQGLQVVDRQLDPSSSSALVDKTAQKKARTMRSQLSAGILLLTKQLDNLSDYQEKQWELRRQINCVPSLPVRQADGDPCTSVSP